MRTSSLDIQEDKNKEDQDNRILKIQMEDANKAIKSLTMELSELQKLVRTLVSHLNSLHRFCFCLGDRLSSAEAPNEFSTKSFLTIAVKYINRPTVLERIEKPKTFLSRFFFSLSLALFVCFTNR